MAIEFERLTYCCCVTKQKSQHFEYTQFYLICDTYHSKHNTRWSAGINRI